MAWKVPLTSLTIGPEEEAAAVRVLRSGWLSMGPEVEAFEHEFAAALDVPYAVAVANATDGLAITYDAVGVASGQRVAMPALTFVASLNVALRRNELPLLIDVTSEDDLTMSANDLAEKLTPDTRLIVTMPYAGYAPEMDPIKRLSARHDVPIVEDACHGLLARARGRWIGTIGEAGVFSFYSNKNMTTGEGGMIVTSDRVLAERMRLIRSHGMTRSSYDHYNSASGLGGPSEYDVRVAGHNFRLDDLRAAIGREQLRKLPDANLRRRQVAESLRAQLLERCPDLQVPFSRHDPAESSHHLFVALLPRGADRRLFMLRLAEAGVQTSIHYTPLHRFAHTAGIWEEPPHLPVLESIEKRIVTLPLGPRMTEDQVAIVVDAVAGALEYRTRAQVVGV